MQKAFETMYYKFKFTESVHGENFSGLNECKHFFGDLSTEVAIQQVSHSFFNRMYLIILTTVFIKGL